MLSLPAICLVLSLLAEAARARLHNAIPRACKRYLDILLSGDVQGRVYTADAIRGELSVKQREGQSAPHILMACGTASSPHFVPERKYAW